MAEEAAVDQRSWGARFGWGVGAIVGVLAGFGATYALEVWLLRGRVAQPAITAGRASSLIVSVFFVCGALAGHAFGARGGKSRYKTLGAALGLLVMLVVWLLLALAR